MSPAGASNADASSRCPQQRHLHLVGVQFWHATQKSLPETRVPTHPWPRLAAGHAHKRYSGREVGAAAGGRVTRLWAAKAVEGRRGGAVGGSRSVPD